MTVTNPNFTKMLVFPRKDFKATIITMHAGAKKNMVGINGDKKRNRNRNHDKENKL